MLEKTVKKIFCFSLCFLLLACAKQTLIPANWQAKGSMSGALWYTYKTNNEEIEIPLLVQAEWQEERAELAFIFLNGGLFAQCTRVDGFLQCIARSSLPYASSIAEKCALLVSESIESIENTDKNTDFSENPFIREQGNIKFILKKINWK